MADVFLSYAREDRARAEQVAHGLEAAGIDVFWDNEIPPGTTWADYIEEKLTHCKALIVLWSEHSTKSQWVREEARMGRDKGVLIPAMIDNAQAPFGFGEVQAANLASWSGDANNPDWNRFVSAVRASLGRTPAPPRPQPAMSAPPRATPAPTPQPRSEGKKGGLPGWAWGLIGVGATIIVLGVIGTMMEGAGPLSSPAEQVTTMNPAVQQPTAPPQPGQSYQDQIMQRLQQVEQAFAAQGYQQISPPVSGQLNQGAQQIYPVTLTSAGDYQLIGVCDNDCSDLDLVLYDVNGNAVTGDSATDATPVVPVMIYAPGQFTIEARMYRCSVQPCYYAVALYGRPLQ